MVHNHCCNIWDDSRFVERISPTDWAAAKRPSFPHLSHSYHHWLHSIDSESTPQLCCWFVRLSERWQLCHEYCRTFYEKSMLWTRPLNPWTAAAATLSVWPQPKMKTETQSFRRHLDVLKWQNRILWNPSFVISLFSYSSPQWGFLWVPSSASLLVNSVHSFYLRTT